MLIRIDPIGRFAVGDTISPGGWDTYLTNRLNATQLILFEKHLESLRLQFNPAAVSRLNCVFSFDTDSGENFLHELGADAANHTVVELCYGAAIISKHNYSVISYFFKLLQNGATLASLLTEEKLMICYWTGTETTQYNSASGQLSYNAEILIGGKAYVTSIR